MVQIAEQRRQPFFERPIFSVLHEGHVALLGCVLGIAGFASGPSLLQLGLLAAACGALGASGIVFARKGAAWARRRLRLAHLDQMMASDAVAMAATDGSGRVLSSNAPARADLGVQGGMPVSAAFGDLFANPLGKVNALLAAAAERGTVRTERVSHRGHIRVSVVANPNDLFVWRVENLKADSAEIGSAEIAVPMAVIDDAGTVLAANRCLSDLCGDPVPDRVDQLLDTARPSSGDMVRIKTASGPVSMRAHIVDAAAGGTCREVFLLPPSLGGHADASALFDTLPVPMIKVDINGDIIVCNQGAHDLLGREVPPRSRLSDALSGLGRPITDWLQDAAAGVAPSRSEFLQVRGNGGERFVQVSLKPVIEDGHKILLAVLTDATELKTLEAQFVQSQKMQAIGQLAGGVAHDFNNLLTAISGHCDLLLLRHDEGDPAYGDLVQINQNANRAASLVGQLLAFSRKQTLSPETVDLPEALSDLTHLLSRLVGETVRLSLSHEDDVPKVRVDKRQLEQVIMNLVVNARDAMRDGGQITVETTSLMLETELRRDRAAIPPGSYAVVRVHDEGHGIPEDKLQKVFEPFYTTKKTGEGTGLGLSTAYGIVKQTGGFIFAEPGAEGGTTFTLYFPACWQTDAPVEAKPVEDGEAQSAPGDGVILLVEDEAPVRAFASRALRLRGYTVLEADCAEEALEKLADPDLNVDVFVTDVVMPGMDGPTWVREALKQRPDTRVVFVSGYAEDALSDHQAQIPHSIFLPKPFSLQDLTRTVQRQFE